MCDMRGPLGFVKVASAFISAALGLMDTSQGHPANTALAYHAGGRARRRPPAARHLLAH
jgi:hypothetical protein